MKKIIAALTVLGIMMSVLSACGSGDTESHSSDIKDTSSKPVSTVKGKLSNDNADKYVKLINYKDIVIDWNTTDNKQILESQLKNDGYAAGTVEITDRPIKTGDTVSIDYEGYMDGKQFEGGTGSNDSLVIGSNSFIEGFESGLIGAKLNETVELDLNFPENYTNNPSLSGKPVKFVVKIKKISETSYEEKDVAAAKESATPNAALTYIIKHSEFKGFPEKSLNFYKDRYNNYYSSTAAAQGYSDFNQFLTDNGQTESGYEDILKLSAENDLKLEICLRAIAKAENITVSDGELDKSVSEYASTYSVTESDVVKQMGKDLIELTLIQEKVNKAIKKYAKSK